MSPWTRLRLALLLVVDRLLGTHLVEREMACLQVHIEACQDRAEAIQQQMQELNRLVSVTQVEFCLLILHRRYLQRPEEYLRFVPAEDADEEKALDLMIEHLMRRGLAAVHAEVIDECTYAYHVHPDWRAICSQLGEQKEKIDPTVWAWLEETRRGENG